MLHIKINEYDIISFNNTPVEIKIDVIEDDKYYVHKDKKWINYCKKHNFNPIRDAHGKIYDLYLQLCAENML